MVAESLAKQYENNVWGARDISFTAGYGEVTVLLGPNGAGKTTTIKMLTTIIRPTRGRGFVAGYDIYRDWRKIRRNIALMPQNSDPDPNWTPYEAVKWYLVTRGFSISDAGREARHWLEELGLWDQRNRSLWGLSGGQGRRVLAAMVLASGAQIVFLDEPSSGLDVEAKYKIWGSIRRACRYGRAIIYTTHEMREAEILADKVVIISNGVVRAIGDPRKLVETLPYRYKILVRDGGEAPNPVAKARVGDVLIAYYANRSDALSAIEASSADRISIEPVSLEDAYLYYIGVVGSD
ncbi:MAG: ABC transporter ATP-binding protein [Sulfolobales archaeon]